MLNFLLVYDTDMGFVMPYTTCNGKLQRNLDLLWCLTCCSYSLKEPSKQVGAYYASVKRKSHDFCLKRCLYYDLQKYLGEMAAQASIENVMRMLVASHKQEETHLWTLCSNLVGKSGLSRETLSNYLPPEVVSVIEQMRQKTGFGYGGSLSSGAITENRTSRMQKALDSSDVELVKLMVMGEGLDLDRAQGLHYAVEKCSM